MSQASRDLIVRDVASDEAGEWWELKPRVMRAGPSVLVVGPDGVGKTTIVRRMSELTGIPTFKCPVEKRIFREGGRSSLAFDYMLTHFLQQTGYRFISDRAYPCEWVYSRVFGRETDPDLLNRIDEAHANLGTIILYLQSSVLPAHEDDLVPPDRYWEVRETYEGFMAWTACRVVRYDTSRSLHLTGASRVDFDAAQCLALLDEKELVL